MKTADMNMKIEIEIVPGGLPVFPYANRDQYYRVLSGILAAQVCGDNIYRSKMWEVQERFYNLFMDRPDTTEMRVDVTGLDAEALSTLSDLVKHLRHTRLS